MATSTFQRIYVWELPVRIYHWVTFVGIVALVGTGLLIGAPLALMSSGDASSQTWFGTVRMIHFIAGMLITFALVLRIYWMFAGNRHATWDNFFPVTPRLFKRQAQSALKVLKADILQVEVQPYDFEGHNGLASWSYGAIFLLTLFQIVTGFGLYAAMSDWWFPQLFAWVVPLMGGDAHVRLWHHLAMWAFVIFTMIHVYLATFHDYTEAHGEISSMVSGSRFLPPHMHR